MRQRALPQKPPMPETKRIGIYQIHHFVTMTKLTLPPESRAFFWDTMRKACPELMQAIDNAFMDEWREITFTRDICIPLGWSCVLTEEEGQP